jgi:hypothetical protein
MTYARVVIVLHLYLLEQCLDPVFWTLVKTCNFVTFYKFLIHLGVHHTTRISGKTNNSSATVAELTTAISAISAAASGISELTAATTKRTAAECGETNDSDAIGEPKWGRNSNNPAVAGRQEHAPKKPKT